MRWHAHRCARSGRRTAKTGAGVIKDLNERSPFRYINTATSRASISRFSKRLEGHVIGIVGLGGTGAYVLDLVSKIPVSAIHLFDDDTFDQHNAFRAPGAAAIEDIARGRTKVEHLSSIYLRMHRGIVPHAVCLGRGRLSMLTSSASSSSASTRRPRSSRSSLASSVMGRRSSIPASAWSCLRMACSVLSG